MSKVLRSFLGKVASLIEIIKGPRSVIDITEPRAEIDSLNAHSHDGYVMQLFCHEKILKIVYKRWYIPNSTKTVYQVFCVIKGTAPDDISEAFSKDRSLPLLVSSLSNSKIKKQAAIEAYLDLVLEKLRKK